MKLHIITVGEPKLAYARAGWEEYLNRLKHYHGVRVTHVPDKHNDSEHLLRAAGGAYKVALTIEGKQLSSHQLAEFIATRKQDGREVAFTVGGPDGLPTKVITASDMQWSFSQLTFPHDLAMVVLAETLYRSSTISDGQPYHR